MTDTFINICKNVLRQPNMNTDLTKFVPEFELYDMDDDDWIFYNRFLRPLMYKAYAHGSQDIKNILKLMLFTSMHRDPPSLFCAENNGELYNKNDNSFGAVIGRRNPKVVPQSVFDLYIKCQKHYHSLMKFLNIIKMRYTGAKNQFDLLLKPISENDKNVYVIIQSDNKYLFRISEFQQIIVTCIGNTEEYFPEILEIKNPYNNMKITDNILYNFYFYLKTNNYKIDELFHAYFISNFKSTDYVSKYEVIIRDRSITNEVKNGHHDKLYPYVLRMFLDYKRYIGDIRISCGFPRKKLVDIMRPYLKLYLYHLYYPRDLPRKYQSEDLLEKRFKQLSIINQTFGQRTIIHNTSTDGKTRCFARYNCLVPRLNSPFYSMEKDDYFTVELKDDIQYYKMVTYFKSADLSLARHTDFHSSDMEDEYEFYVDNYYRRQRIRMRRYNTFDEEKEESDEETEETEETEESGEEKEESDDEITNSDDTVIDRDDGEPPIADLLNRLNNGIIDPNDIAHDNNDLEPRISPPTPHNVTMRTPQLDMLTRIQLEPIMQYNDMGPDEIMELHEEVVSRVMSTFTEMTQRLNNITYPLNVNTTEEDENSSCATSIREPRDDECETNSVDVGATIENVTQCSEDVNVVANNMSSQPINEEISGKYIVRAMIGSQETRYTVKLVETFYTAEVAHNFYENLSLNYYNLKEIEFVPSELLNSNEAQNTQNIINYEEKNTYDPSRYTNNSEVIETSETRNVLDMFLCDDCNLRSIKNKCFICNRHDVCNYCNGDNVWCKQNDDWICRDCHNNRRQEEYIEEEAENEEEIVSSSLMTYGIPLNADMTSDEYMHSRMEEIARNSYLERGFTEEDHDAMQNLRMEEYGSDGEREDY